MIITYKLLGCLEPLTIILRKCRFTLITLLNILNAQIYVVVRASFILYSQGSDNEHNNYSG